MSDKKQRIDLHRKWKLICKLRKDWSAAIFHHQKPRFLPLESGANELRSSFRTAITSSKVHEFVSRPWLMNRGGKINIPIYMFPLRIFTRSLIDTPATIRKKVNCFPREGNESNGENSCDGARGMETRESYPYANGTFVPDFRNSWAKSSASNEM